MTQTPVTKAFSDFGLPATLLKGVEKAGFETPSPIQEAAIPAVLAGKDVIGQAQTGTGKTAAWGLPLMARLAFDKSVEALILTPTRELAMQVADELFRLGLFANVKTACVVGGQSLERQVEVVNKGVQIVVATPGRLLDHLRENRFKKFTPRMVVLDEADEMLDMGFMDDLKAIMEMLPPERQTLLFSATLPPPIQALAKNILKKPFHIKLNRDNEGCEGVDQRLYLIEEGERMDALIRLLDAEDPSRAIVFCRMKRDVDEVAQILTERGYPVRAIHGDLNQSQRQQTLTALKSGHTRVIVATDVAARGIDIKGLTHVINYHVPDNRSRYIHRIGRTARAGQTGVAMTLATQYEIRQNSTFDRRHANEFTPSQIPTRADAVARLGSRLTAEVRSVELASEWVSLCEDLLAEQTAVEVVGRMFTMLMGKRRVMGRDTIGASANDARKYLSRGGMGKARFGFNRDRDRDRDDDRERKSFKTFKGFKGPKNRGAKFKAEARPKKS
jgi:ATP-dependent RNA helicase DeaD